MSHDAILRDVLAGYDLDKVLVLRAISAGEDLFRSALRASPSDLSARNTTLLEFLLPAKSIHIETPSGSYLDVRLDSERHHWISNRGLWRPGRYVILPAGEVATYPANIDGVFVADFAFNLNAITDRDTRLDRFPVRMDLRNGRLAKFSCESVEVTKLLDECFATECVLNVGELGFGTNHQIKSAVSENSHINERCPGVHLGFGQHNQHPEVVPYQCEIHLDLITKGGLVWADCASAPIDLSSINPSPNPHPEKFRDEDVFSPNEGAIRDGDCCGMFRSESLGLLKV